MINHLVSAPTMLLGSAHRINPFISSTTVIEFDHRKKIHLQLDLHNLPSSGISQHTSNKTETVTSDWKKKAPGSIHHQDSDATDPKQILVDRCKLTIHHQQRP